MRITVYVCQMHKIRFYSYTVSVEGFSAVFIFDKTLEVSTEFNSVMLQPSRKAVDQVYHRTSWKGGKASPRRKGLHT